MNKVLVQALENFTYDHADRKIGDQFEAEADHARVFNAHGKTKLVDDSLPHKMDLPSDKPLPTGFVQTSEQKAEADEDTERRRNKRYKRRDMRPEE